MQAFVPKNRRPRFELILKIEDLNNIPLVRGCAYVKWYIPSSPTAEHRGRTEKEGIRDHKAVFNYVRSTVVRLHIDRNGTLQNCDICFEVLQEYGSGSRGDKIRLGSIRLNLAEYVESSQGVAGIDDSQQRPSPLRPPSSRRTSVVRPEAGIDTTSSALEDGITRRYLLQDSRVNSTLKITIQMRQLDGDRSFIAPPLKSAPVFGGIAGIMTAEQRDGSPDDSGNLPTMSSKMREQGELQDMYRQTLAASWAAMKDELPADRCVESIFAGGDGWAREKRDRKNEKRSVGEDGVIDEIDESGDAEEELNFGNDGASIPNGSIAQNHKRAGSKSLPSSPRVHHRQRSQSQPYVPLGKPYTPSFNMPAREKEQESTNRTPKSSLLATGRGTLTQRARQQNNATKEATARKGLGKKNEVSEFDVVDDLRGWSIS